MLECYLTAGMPLGRLAPLVLRHGVSPGCLRRLAFLAEAGLGGTLLGAEPLGVGAVEDPLIILGHWRTGTTLLHQLLDHDPRFAAPTLLQTVYPAAFKGALLRAAPKMRIALPETRPMDQVRLGLEEPQEDEGALWRLCGLSPLERLVFPEDERYFLNGDLDFLPPPSELPRWEQALLGFVRRVAEHTGRRVVLKNPFHSVRVPVLERLFPNARYLRIHRDPREVIPSTVHMWTLVGEQNRLRRAGGPPALDDVITVFEGMQAKMERDLKAVPAERQTLLRFSDLETRPTETVGAAMEAIGVGLPAASEQAVRAFAESVRGYKKNERPARPDDQRRIEERLRAFME